MVANLVTLPHHFSTYYIILGTLVGAFIGAVSAFIREWLIRRRERRMLTKLSASEVIQLMIDVSNKSCPKCKSAFNEMKTETLEDGTENTFFKCANCKSIFKKNGESLREASGSEYEECLKRFTKPEEDTN